MNMNNYSNGFKEQWEKLSQEDKQRFESIADQYHETIGKKNQRYTNASERDKLANAANEATRNLVQAVYEVESGQF